MESLELPEEVKPFVIFDGDLRMALEEIQGNRASSHVDLGFMELFHVALGISGPL